MNTENQTTVTYNTKCFRSTYAGLMDETPFIVQQGGTYSGKTFNILLAIHAWLAANPNAAVTASVVGVTVPHLKRGALRDFTDIAEMLGAQHPWNKTDNVFDVRGNRLEFFSADDDGKVRGGKRDILFINECNLISYARARQLILRTRATVILDFNPVSRFWVHDKILNERKCLFKRTTYRDNPTTPKRIVDEIEQLQNDDPELYAVFGLGQIGKITGLVFPNVKWVDAWPPPEQMKKRAYGLDWGFTNDPTALVEMGVHDGALYGRELLYERGLTTGDIDGKLSDLGLERKPKRGRPTPNTSLIVADNSEPRLIAELNERGWWVVPTTKGANSIQHGIDRLKQQPLRLTRNSLNWKTEQQAYKWLVDKSTGDATNRPVDKFNHLWDAARYYALHQLTNQRRSVRIIKTVRK